MLHAEKEWDRGRWVMSPQVAVHMAAARLGAMVGIGLANSHLSRLRKC